MQIYGQRFEYSRSQTETLTKNRLTLLAMVIYYGYITNSYSLIELGDNPGQE